MSDFHYCVANIFSNFCYSSFFDLWVFKNCLASFPNMWGFPKIFHDYFWASICCYQGAYLISVLCNILRVILRSSMVCFGECSQCPMRINNVYFVLVCGIQFCQWFKYVNSLVQMLLPLDLLCDISERLLRKVHWSLIVILIVNLSTFS